MRKLPDTPQLARAPARGDTSGLIVFMSALAVSLFKVLTEHAFRLNRVLPVDGTETMTGPLKLKSFTTATRPTASDHTGGVIFVSDGGAGSVFQGSDGTSWVSLG